VSVKEHEEAVAQQKAEETHTQEVATDATVQAITQAQSLCWAPCLSRQEEQQALEGAHGAGSYRRSGSTPKPRL
jgi:hypothetical protein